MEPSTRTHSKADVRFLKAAVAMQLITSADAKRCLSLVAKGGTAAPTAAEKAGLIASEDIARIERRLAKRTAKASRPEEGSKRQGKARPRRSVPVALVAGAGFGVAALVGLAIAFAFSGGDTQAEVAVISDTPASPQSAVVSPAVDSSPKPAVTKKAPKTDRFAQKTLQVVRKLHESGKTRAALDILDEMPKPNAAARRLRKELEAALAREVKAPVKRTPAPVQEDEDEDQGEDEDEVDWPDDAEDTVEWPDDAEAVAAAPRPRDVAGSKPASSVTDADGDEVDTGFDDDEDDAGTTTGFDEDDEDDDLGIDTNSPVAMAVGELLCVPFTLLTNADLTVSYPLQEGSELEDFESVGFDKFEVGSAVRSAGAYSESVMGLEIGAGSQRLGRMWHAVRLQDQFEVDMRLWVNAGDSRSRLVFLFGKKLGVSWGQQIVKVSRSGSTRPLSGKVDRNAFRGERFVRVKISLRDNVMTVYFDGRKTAERKLKPKDLKGRFGMIAKGVRFQVTELRINGLVDRGAL